MVTITTLGRRSHSGSVAYPSCRPAFGQPHAFHRRAAALVPTLQCLEQEAIVAMVILTLLAAFVRAATAGCTVTG